MTCEITFKISDRALGDALCCIHAARAYSRRVNERELRIGDLEGTVIYIDDQEEVVRAYGDTLVHLGNRGRVVDLTYQAAPLHRLKVPGIYCNYLGTFMAQIGATPDPDERLELPSFPSPPVDTPYLVLQPFAGFAQPNLSVDLIQKIINLAGSVGFKVLIVGRFSTPQKWTKVDYSMLGSAMNFLHAIQHASGVLTPRSAAAHVAAGYRTEALVWTVNDGEDWHLDYNWFNTRIAIREGDKKILSAVEDTLIRWKKKRSVDET